jgi:Sec-independent protein translocase protein TatA
MPQFTPNEWFIVALVFLLGLILGMAMMASGKWKGRYREEVRKREAAEAERSRLESQLKHAEARTIAATARDPAPVRDTRDTPIA